jgi:hypothetical protein
VALDTASIETELNLMRNQDGISWQKIKDYLRGKLAEAAISGSAVVSYTINGRSVTRSIDQIERMLKIAEARGPAVVVVLGEFG